MSKAEAEIVLRVFRESDLICLEFSGGRVVTLEPEAAIDVLDEITDYLDELDYPYPYQYDPDKYAAALRKDESRWVLTHEGHERVTAP